MEENKENEVKKLPSNVRLLHIVKCKGAMCVSVDDGIESYHGLSNGRQLKYRTYRKKWRIRKPL